MDMIRCLKNAKVIKIEVQDRGYDYTLLGQNIDQTLGDAMAQICFVLQKVKQSRFAARKKRCLTHRLKYFFYGTLAKMAKGKLRARLRGKMQKYYN
jgi:hypothetical protein